MIPFRAAMSLVGLHGWPRLCLLALLTCLSGCGNKGPLIVPSPPSQHPPPGQIRPSSPSTEPSAADETDAAQPSDSSSSLPHL